MQECEPSILLTLWIIKRFLDGNIMLLDGNRVDTSTENHSKQLETRQHMHAK